LFGAHIAKWGDWPDVIGFIGDHFGLDLSPLERVFAPNNGGTMEDWESTAQPPAELAGCLRNLVQALESNPSVFDEVMFSPEHPSDYFMTGHFVDDLRGILQIAEWAEENGEKWVRLYYG
jgi:hypothetical protein